jgi:adenosylcobinamide-GDP ribazoletransferase
MFKNFITAVQFLTIVTVKKHHDVAEGDLAKSVVYFPLVGFLIGFVLINADKAFALVALPQSIATFMLVLIWVVITRAIHIDGLADTFDGLMGGTSHASRLAIMQDSRLGTAGALGIFFVLIMKYLCLNSLYESDRISALLVAPVVARWAQSLMVFNSEYGRENGMGKAFVGHLRSSGLAATSVLAIGLTAFVILRLDVRSLLLFSILICVAVLFTYLGKRFLVHKLGGVTGDAIGAVSELNEALVLLLFVIFSGGT